MIFVIALVFSYIFISWVEIIDQSEVDYFLLYNFYKFKAKYIYLLPTIFHRINNGYWVTCNSTTKRMFQPQMAR